MDNTSANESLKAPLLTEDISLDSIERRQLTNLNSQSFTSVNSSTDKYQALVGMDRGDAASFRSVSSSTRSQSASSALADKHSSSNAMALWRKTLRLMHHSREESSYESEEGRGGAIAMWRRALRLIHTRPMVTTPTKDDSMIVSRNLTTDSKSTDCDSPVTTAKVSWGNNTSYSLNPLLASDNNSPFISDDPYVFKRAAQYISDGKNGRHFRHSAVGTVKHKMDKLVQSLWLRAIFFLVVLIHCGMGINEMNDQQFRQASFRDGVDVAANTLWETASCMFYVAVVALKIGAWGTSFFKSQNGDLKFWALFELSITFVIAFLTLLALVIPTAVDFRMSNILIPLLLFGASRTLRHTSAVIFKTFVNVIPLLIVWGAFNLVYAHIGVIIFRGVYNYAPTVIVRDSFNSVSSGLLSLLIMYTSENYPDIMYRVLDSTTVPADFYPSRWYAIYFMFYVLFSVLVSALVLGNICYYYKIGLRDQVVKDLCRERIGLILAFHTITGPTQVVTFEQWERLLKELLPESASNDFARVTFVLEDADGNGRLDLEEFCQMSDLLKLRFELCDQDKNLENQSMLSIFGPYLCMQSLVNSMFFQSCRVFLTLLTVTVVCLYSNDFSEDDINRWNTVVYILFGLYIIEVCGILFANGLRQFIRIPWNLYEVIVLIICIFFGSLKASFNLDRFPGFSLIILRVFVIVRPSVIKRSFISLIPGIKDQVVKIEQQFLLFLLRSWRVTFYNGGLIVIVFYIWICLGMFIFGNVFLQVQDGIDKRTDAAGSMVGFQTFFNGCVCLFQIIITNNWNDIIYTATTATGTLWASIFFVIYFGIVVILMLNVMIALVIDNYERMRYATDESPVVILSIPKATPGNRGSRPSVVALSPSPSDLSNLLRKRDSDKLIKVEELERWHPSQDVNDHLGATSVDSTTDDVDLWSVSRMERRLSFDLTTEDPAELLEMGNQYMESELAKIWNDVKQRGIQPLNIRRHTLTYSPASIAAYHSSVVVSDVNNILDESIASGDGRPPRQIRSKSLDSLPASFNTSLLNLIESTIDAGGGEVRLSRALDDSLLPSNRMSTVRRYAVDK